MVEVFIGCAPGDRVVAEAIAARLRANAEVSVVLDAGASETANEKWEGGMSAAGILLLMSPEAVPNRVSREDWEGLIEHIQGNAEPPVGIVVVRECGFPVVLKKHRSRVFEWNGGVEVQRAIEAWALKLHKLPAQATFVPARLPWFEGRQQELGWLWERLVDRAGAAAMVTAEEAWGKTALAQEFARQAGAHFRDIYWVSCGGRTPDSIVAELADQVGGEWHGEPSEVFTRMLRKAGEHRVLVVLDDFDGTLPLPDWPLGFASLLVTARVLETSAEALTLRGEPEHTLGEPTSEADRKLWRAMAACRNCGFPLDLAARVSQMQWEDARAACERLVRARLVDPFEESKNLFRLSWASLDAAGGLGEDERQRHAEAVYETVFGAAKGREFEPHYFAEIPPAFEWLVVNDWARASKFALAAFALFKRRERTAEGAGLLVALRNEADYRGDAKVAEECSYELSWIQGVQYEGAVRAPLNGNQMSFSFGD